MAEAKKDGKKDAKKDSGAGGAAPEVEILFFLFISVVVLFVVLPTLLKFAGFTPTFAGIATWWNNALFSAGRAFSAFVGGVIFISVFLCLLFILGIIYVKFQFSLFSQQQETSKEKPGETWGKEQAAVARMSDKDPLSLPANLPGAADDASVIARVENEKWKEVKKHMESSNQADWRLAILEADIMLYDMLDQMGYEGDSIAEKLKKVEPASFNTLDEAWRAHKVRNIIAHEGGSYVLSRNEAERAIRQFETVFKEFYYI